MRKMLKDQTYAGKKRVADSKKRRCASQRRQADRREVRRMRKAQVRVSPLIRFLENWNPMPWQKALIKAMENLAQGFGDWSRIFIQASRRQGKTQAEKFFEPYFEEQKPRMMYSDVEATARLQEKAALTVVDPELRFKL